MATRDANTNGEIIGSGASASSAKGRYVTQAVSFAYYNQTNIVIYKLMGKCSTHGWDVWENASGDEAGRDIHGTQEPGTIVAARLTPQGF